MKKLLAAAILVGIILVGQGTAYAVPILQLYIEGAHYDESTETWVVAPPGSSGGEPFRLWAIGNVAGPGGAGAISDVRLSVVYDATLYGQIQIVFTPSRIGGNGYYDEERFVDPSEPNQDLDPNEDGIQNPLFIQEQLDGTILPQLSDGKDLPSHGVFGPDKSWQEFLLGDFALTDSTVADFILPDDFSGTEPFDISDIADTFDLKGQINAYEVTALVGGAPAPSGTVLHFDLYDNVQTKNKVKATFAPFSHDADAEAHIIPEPASFIVWFLIGLSWAGSAWTHQYRRRWKKWQQEEAAGVARIPGDDQAGRFTDSGDRLEEEVGIRPAGRWAAHRSGR